MWHNGEAFVIQAMRTQWRRSEVSKGAETVKRWKGTESPDRLRIPSDSKEWRQ